MIRFPIVLALVALMLGVLFAACGDDNERTFETDNGDVTVSEDLPDDFPDDFPIYPDADLEGSARGEEQGTEGYVVTWQTNDDEEDVIAFYDEEFGDDKPWREVSRSEVGGSTFYAVTNEDESLAGTLYITRENGNVSIVAIVGEEGLLDDGVTPDGDGGDATPDESDDSGSGDDASGGGSLPEEEELSDDFPEDRVPLPDDIRVTNSTSIQSGETSTHLVEFYSEMSVDDLRSYFGDELTGNGWTEVFSTDQDGETLLSFSASDSGAVGAGVTVVIRESDVEGYRTVTLTVTE